MCACAIEECGEKSPWICHVCDQTGTGESQSCAQCYMVTCPAHLQVKAVYNEENSLYELQTICLLCASKEMF